MNFQKEVSLKAHNTFGLDVKADLFVSVASEQALIEVLKAKPENQNLMILGGGSNVLLTKDVEGLVLKNEIGGVEILEENDDFVEVKVGSGLLWHEFVLWSVERNLGGVENLSLIPGTVGAAPIQNIGAYGVELKDVFVSLEAISLDDYQKRIYLKEECQFGYRDSVFKRKYKAEYCIVSVNMKLSKNPIFNTSYGPLKQTLIDSGTNENDLSVKAISDAVIFIRNTKLPDPKSIGNAGSFFKNPVVGIETLEELKHEYPDIPYYALGEGKVKIPAAWLIQKCDWKGYRAGDIGVHDKQALVLVNYGEGLGLQLKMLSEKIIESVNVRFGILLESEVNVI